MENEVLLKLENISVRYGGVRALDGVDIFIDEGEIVALMGPNGAGKSTVLKAIFGLAPVANGKISFHQSELKPIPYEMAERGISFVPQGRRVFNHLTIEENLEIGGFILKDKEEIERRMEEIMDIFPVLKHKRKMKAGVLSGGEQQMLAFGRGLMTDPRILLLDEPSLGLSPKIVKEVFAKIKEINQKHKIAIMIVEHNIKSLLRIASRTYVLDKGRIHFHGPAKELEKNDILEKVFLGK